MLLFSVFLFFFLFCFSFLLLFPSPFFTNNETTIILIQSPRGLGQSRGRGKSKSKKKKKITVLRAFGLWVWNVSKMENGGKRMNGNASGVYGWKAGSSEPIYVSCLLAFARGFLPSCLDRAILSLMVLRHCAARTQRKPFALFISNIVIWIIHHYTLQVAYGRTGKQKPETLNKKTIAFPPHCVALLSLTSAPRL